MNKSFCVVSLNSSCNKSRSQKARETIRDAYTTARSLYSAYSAEPCCVPPINDPCCETVTHFKPSLNRSMKVRINLASRIRTAIDHRKSMMVNKV